MSETVRVDELADQDPLLHEPVVEQRYAAVFQAGHEVRIFDEEEPTAWITSDLFVEYGGGL